MMYEVNLHIETDAKAPKVKKGHYVCVLEYITATGKSCTLNVMGSERDTSRQRLELVALLAAVRRMTKPSKIRVFTQYSGLLAPVKNGWLKQWQENGFQTVKGEPVKNADLWKELSELLEKHMIHEEHQEHEYRQWMLSELAKMKEAEG